MSYYVTKKLALVVLTIITRSYLSNYVTTVLDSVKYYSLNSNEEKINFELETDVPMINKYTVWGWLKFTESKPGISNFFILSGIKSSGNIVSPTKTNDPKYPACPYSFNDLRANLDLREQPEILNNPNCFLDQINSNADLNLKNNIEDYLVINHELLQGGDTYSLTFLLINGFTQNDLDFEIARFDNIPFKPNLWSYFAVSCNYETGIAIIHIKEFNLSIPIDKSTKISLNFPNFEMRRRNQILLANREKSPYFDFAMNNFFIGNIAYIEAAPFFTNKVQNLWAGFLPKTSYSYNGILMEILFDLYEKNQEFMTKGFKKKSIKLDGEYIPLYTIDKNKLGVRVVTNASLNLGSIDFEIVKEIKPFLFYFELIYKNQLPDNFILLERGNEVNDGYIKISIIKQENGRTIKFSIVGTDNELTWNSSSILPENQKIFFVVGVVLSPGKSIDIIYYDSTGTLNIDLLSNNFMFNFLPQDIILFKQSEDNRNNLFTGYVDFLKFEILNSASSIIFKDIFNEIANKDLVDLIGQCDLKTDYYKESFLCLRCKNSVLTEDRVCANFCPIGFQNYQNDVCLKCKEGECQQNQKTTFKIEKVSNTKYRLIPTRELLDFEKIDFKNLFQITIDKKNKEIGNFNYQTLVNTKNQTIDYDFEFKEKIYKNNLEFEYIQNTSNPYFDINRNILENQKIDIHIKEVCYIEESKDNALVGLAVFVLVVFLVCFIVLIVYSLFVRKIRNIGYFWKFFLHSWMNFQLVTFFLFYGVDIPCCVQRFLHILFLVSVRWDYALRWAINNENHWKSAYDRGVRVPNSYTVFRTESVKNPALHNMGLLFVFHLVFLLFYIIYKIWSCLKNNQKLKNYINNIEFTGIIVAFLVFHYHIIIFPMVNLQNSNFDLSYFGFSFIISLIYVLLFAFGLIYFGIIFIRGGVFFMDKINRKRYSYFLSGNRERGHARLYDYIKIFIHFFIGVLLATAYDLWTFQSVFIFLLILILLVVTLVLRPWKYFIHQVWEIISLVILLALTIIFLIIATKDDEGCLECIDREGAVCWFIVLLIFFLCIISCFILLLMLYLAHSQPASLGEDTQNFQKITKKEEKNVKTKNDLLEEVISSHSFLLDKKEDLKVADKNTSENVQKDTIDDFMKKMNKEREIDFGSRNEAFNFKHYGGGNLLPDSEDEDSKIPKVLYSIINFKEEQEEVNDFTTQDFFANDDRNKNQDFRNRNDFGGFTKSEFNQYDGNQFISDEEDDYNKKNVKEDQFDMYYKKNFFN